MIKVEALYFELCNFFGDGFNVRYLKDSSDEIEVIETAFSEEPYFVKHDVNLIVMGSTTEERQERIIEKLRPYKGRILELILKDVPFLITGNALEIFGEKIEKEDGSVVEGLGIYPTVAKQKMLARHNSLFLGKMEGMEIVGYKSQFAHSYGDNEKNYAFEVINGVGLSPEVKKEGIRIHNFIATYVLGPLLPLNPDFTEWLLKKAGVKNPKAKYSEEARKAWEIRVEEFRKLKAEM